MHPKTIYNKLNLIADKLNIKIIKGKGNFKGGCCVIKEEAVIVVNQNKPFEERVRNLALGLGATAVATPFIQKAMGVGPYEVIEEEEVDEFIDPYTALMMARKRDPYMNY